MGGIIDQFVVSLALQADGFVKGERDVETATRKLRENSKVAFTEMEGRAKSAGSVFQGLRNEVVGLGLAFMGAQSVGGFLWGMMQTAATADRLGQTMAMSAEKVGAWRLAMKGIVGGSIGDADSALQAIQSAKMNWRVGGNTGNDVAWKRLGINANDLETKDPGDILRKLAGASERMKPTDFAYFAQQIGLSSPMISFLMQGQSKVDKLIAANEKNTKGQEELAKQTEQLQQSLVNLQAVLEKQLIPPLKEIADALNVIVPVLAREIPAVLGGKKNAWDYIGDEIGGPAGAWIKQHMGAANSDLDRFTGHAPSASGSGPLRNTGGGAGAASAGDDAITRWFILHGMSHDQALGIRAGIYGEGGSTTAVNPKTGAYGIGQWLGPRKAELFRRYGPNPTLAQQLEFMLWELRGGDHGGSSVLSGKDANDVALRYFKDFMRPQGKNNEHYRDLIRDINRGNSYIRGHSHPSTVTIHQMTVNTRATDARGIARDIKTELRRSAVAQADRGVAP